MRTDSNLREILRRYGVWIGLTLAFALYYPRFAHDMSQGIARGGLSLLTHGAECLLAGEVLQACDLFFTYPPAFAFVMLPFVPMKPGIAMVVWYLVTIGATIVAYMLSETLARRIFPGDWTEKELAWLRLGSILLSIKFILAVLENQAFDTLVLLFILIGLWALVMKREVLSGGSIAFAAAIKGSPLIFLPYLLFTRRFVAAGTFIGVYLATSFLPDLFFTPKSGFGYFLTWVREIALGPLYDDLELTKYLFWAGVNSNNHSLRAVAYQLFPSGLADPWFRPTLAAMYLPVVAAAAIIVIKSMRNGGLVAIDGAVVLIAMLVLSPMTSRSHFVALILPYTIACAAYIRDPATRRLGQIVLVISFILATATGNDLVGGWFTDWAYSLHVLALGSLLLLIYLAAIAFRQRMPSQAAQLGR
ncbi:MAG: DUF2029 domain-containing protein [Pseudolabrys sp.]|nr:DUF2029 domain-containing protein [Pseudolabrys sp.]